MRLLHVISSMDPRTGGPCQAVRNLFAPTVESANTMEVVCLDDPDSNHFTQERLPIHALGSGRGPWNYHPAFKKWLDQNLPRFDAVILNGLWHYPGYALSKASMVPNSPPYFVYPHGMLDPWFQRAPERRLKAVRNWLHWKLVERHVIHRARALVFTCEEEMRLARNTFRPYQPRLQINVGYGIAQPPECHAGMAAALAEKCPRLDGNPFLLFLGRIHPKKGVDILIQSYSALCQAHLTGQGTRPPKLVIAGPGLETSFGQQMQILAAKICPSDSVFWPGMLADDAKWGALNHADAFVLTSHQENFGIAVAEALACGTPVLISNQINIWREIEADKAGLVAADTVAGARQLLQRWHGFSMAERNAMKRAAKSCYGKNFRVASAAAKLLATIQDLTVPSTSFESPLAMTPP